MGHAEGAVQKGIEDIRGKFIRVLMVCDFIAALVQEGLGGLRCRLQGFQDFPLRDLPVYVERLIFKNQEEPPGDGLPGT